MTSFHHFPFAEPQVLVSVHDLREEVRAGLGNAHVAVRTLDGVSLTVHAGEFVIVRGGVASGATSLLAALAGRRTLQSGSRIVAPSVQIRRGAIGSDAMEAMRRAWREPAPREALITSRTPVLYLFRVRGHASLAPRNSAVQADRWTAWARSLRVTGGSVLVHTPVALPHSADTRAIDLPGKHSPAVFENTAGERQLHSRPAVREFTIAAGRMVSADPATRPMWFRGSDGYAPPNACDPYPTTWPAP